MSRLENGATAGHFFEDGEDSTALLGRAGQLIEIEEILQQGGVLPAIEYRIGTDARYF